MDLKQDIENYIPFNEQEEIDKITFLKFIETFDDVLTRNNIFGHFTGSAFVVNEDFSKTLMIKHNIYGNFVYPGGHADGESNLLSVAIREVSEETGLEVKPVDNEIFAISAYAIAGHVKNRKICISTHTL